MGWGPMLPTSHRSLCARPRGPLGTNTYSGHLCARDREFLSKEQSTLLPLFGLISKRKMVSRRLLWIGSHGLRSCCQNLVSMRERPCFPVAGNSGHPKTLATMNPRAHLLALAWACSPPAPSIFQASWPLLMPLPVPRMFFPHFCLDHYFRSYIAPAHLNITLLSEALPDALYHTWSCIFQSPLPLV